jgi:hypothetical protein
MLSKEVSSFQCKHLHASRGIDIEKQVTLRSTLHDCGQAIPAQKDKAYEFDCIQRISTRRTGVSV